MPFLKLELSRRPSRETVARLASTLTDLTAELLHKKRELTVVAVESLAPHEWSVGGVGHDEQASPCGFHLQITVTEGTNTKDEKAAFIDRTFAAIEAIVGAVEPTSYVVVHEVRADAWGYGGRTQQHRTIAAKAL